MSRKVYWKMYQKLSINRDISWKEKPFIVGKRALKALRGKDGNKEGRKIEKFVVINIFDVIYLPRKKMES